MKLIISLSLPSSSLPSPSDMLCVLVVFNRIFRMLYIIFHRVGACYICVFAIFLFSRSVVWVVSVVFSVAWVVSVVFSVAWFVSSFFGSHEKCANNWKKKKQPRRMKWNHTIDAKHRPTYDAYRFGGPRNMFKNGNSKNSQWNTDWVFTPNGLQYIHCIKIAQRWF